MLFLSRRLRLRVHLRSPEKYTKCVGRGYWGRINSEKAWQSVSRRGNMAYCQKLFEQQSSVTTRGKRQSTGVSCALIACPSFDVKI
jgi:hypothetical protein